THDHAAGVHLPQLQVPVAACASIHRSGLGGGPHARRGGGRIVQSGPTARSCPQAEGSQVNVPSPGTAIDTKGPAHDMTSTASSSSQVAAGPGAAAKVGCAVEAVDLNIYYGTFLAVAGVSMTIEPNSVTAFIGPSGCGKSTFLRSLNRMHEV